MKTVKKIVLGTALAATSLAIAAPASAQDYNRYHRHSGDGASAASRKGTDDLRERVLMTCLLQIGRDLHARLFVGRRMAGRAIGTWCDPWENSCAMRPGGWTSEPDCSR